MLAATIPSGVLYRMRAYAAGYVFDTPILGACIKAMGHFEVPFTSTEEGDFSVDRVKLEKTQQRVDRHIRSQGVLSFFPEGQLNSNPAEIMVGLCRPTLTRVIVARLGCCVHTQC